MHYGTHGVDIRMAGEGLQAIAQQRLPTERAILLRQIAAHALSAASGNDYGGCLERGHRGARVEPGTEACQAGFFAIALRRLLLQFAAILSMLPASLLLLRRHPRRDAGVWCALALALAVAGPTTLVAVQNAARWLPSLSG